MLPLENQLTSNDGLISGERPTPLRVSASARTISQVNMSNAMAKHISTSVWRPPSFFPVVSIPWKNPY